MKPVRFDYVRADSVEHALDCLRDGETKPIAGGQSLLPMMNFRIARPERLVDIDGLVALDRVAETPDGGLLVGGLVRHARLARDPLVRERVPLLAEAARHIGHGAIRNRGTIGGSLAHADPTAELPAACIALEARFICDRADGRRRTIDAAEFFRGRYSTALEEDELLTWVRFPAPASPATRGWGFAEIAPREGDFAWAGACAVLRGTELRCVVFGLETTARALHIPSSGPRPGELEAFLAELSPNDEPEFRRELGLEMLRRAVAQAGKGLRTDGEERTDG